MRVAEAITKIAATTGDMPRKRGDDLETVFMERPRR
jgi:hypothetical protein